MAAAGGRLHLIDSSQADGGRCLEEACCLLEGVLQLNREEGANFQGNPLYPILSSRRVIIVLRFAWVCGWGAEGFCLDVARRLLLP